MFYSFLPSKIKEDFEKNCQCPAGDILVDKLNADWACKVLYLIKWFNSCIFFHKNMLKLKVHDLCYELYGQSEEQCDDLFWMNIKTLCPPNGIFGVKMCRTGADMAWETLQDWGHVAYSDYWKKKNTSPSQM